MSSSTIAAVTGTIYRLFGISWAGGLEGDLEAPLEAVVGPEVGLGAPLEKILLYAPDAIGRHFCDAYPEILAPVLHHAPIVVDLQSVVPPVTPVCFSSMFSGFPPAVHGIRKYEKPVLKCHTLFDRLVSAGKKAAIVAVRDSSIDRIFRERPIDYFSEQYDPQVTERALQVIANGAHDFVLVYHQEYDDALHRTTPRSSECLAAARNHVASFEKLSEAMDRFWASSRRAIGFVPDHGAHIDPATGKGTHGLDISEDMDVRHFYRVSSPHTGDMGDIPARKLG